jgi:hypothetical protein
MIEDKAEERFYGEWELIKQEEVSHTEIVLSLILRKNKFPNFQDASKWAISHGYNLHSYRELDTAWAIRPQQLIKCSKQDVKRLDDGVVALTGVEEK